ncbi:Aste57867_14559 [Aphanomyces stellatus]|uniref:Aste57867_14559 protein n=1 Tax=Aphanomyces stellatus TaxID=120398 RepID=A0A485L0Z0_9STRA|nr:hypothetical protein As57867_014505 [Aphanomyces stellatus]VFT91379.1 Aste57867_14559 [Aphanomyces stellatus]
MRQRLAVGWHMQQRGPRFRSNNAGDGPEKTRDRKFWFPRFKSTLLGSFRSKATFVLCECGLPPSSPDGVATQRSKTTNGHHCACGRDEWHLAKKAEETEYNVRLEVSKYYGGIRYDDALAQHTIDVERACNDPSPLRHRLPCAVMSPAGCLVCGDHDRQPMAQLGHLPATTTTATVTATYGAYDGQQYDAMFGSGGYNDLTPLPLKMDERATHWKDPGLVREYLECFLDGVDIPLIKHEFVKTEPPSSSSSFHDGGFATNVCKFEPDGGAYAL